MIIYCLLPNHFTNDYPTSMLKQCIKSNLNYSLYPNLAAGVFTLHVVQEVQLHVL